MISWIIHKGLLTFCKIPLLYLQKDCLTARFKGSSVSDSYLWVRRAKHNLRNQNLLKPFILTPLRNKHMASDPVSDCGQF